MSPKDKAEDIQVEPDQEHFPSLTPNNLKDLKRFWIRLNSILYPTESDPMRPEDQQLHKSMIDAYELQEFQLSFWNWIMMDDPDTMVCKFLRARKFEVFESLKMLINCLRWRIERKVDQIIESDEIGNQLKTGKAFVHGFDKKGCPIFRITASKHISGAQAPEIVEDFVIYSIESIRLFMIPPNESATILVDLGGFGTSNMDWKCTSFMTNCLEAYYPETLHCSVINRAPWIFTGIWKVIQSMLDPVVKEKVIFSKNEQDLQRMISKSNLLKSESGDSDFEWSYSKPSSSSSTLTTSTETSTEVPKEDQELLKAKELSTRLKLIEIFNALNHAWLKVQQTRINNANSNVDSKDKDQEDNAKNDKSDDELARLVKARALLKLILRAHYFKLLPLIKSSNVYYRHKNLSHQEPGIVKFYLKNSKKVLSDDEKVLNNKEEGKGANEEQEVKGGNIVVLGQKSCRKSLLARITEELENLKKTKGETGDDPVYSLINQIEIDSL